MFVLAMDRAAESVRRFDIDGRLHVATSPISKVQTRDYIGREVPGGREAGLDPDRIYTFLCPADELKKAVGDSNNIQILSEHVPVSSWHDDSHMAELTVGSTGTDGEFDGTYLKNSLVIWNKKSIDGIVSNRQRELSFAYRFIPDMTPGNFNGIDYDGVMRDIKPNHVALVIEGRAGPDVAVGDEKPMAYKSKKAYMLGGSLVGLLAPKLAQDAKLNLTPVLKNVSARSLAADGAAARLGAQIFGLVQPHLAQDAGLDVEDVCRVIDAVKGAPLAEDEDDEIPMSAMDEESDEEKAEREKREAEEKEGKEAPAMDTAKIIAQAVAAAEAKATALRVAERDVRAVVGDLSVAMDSAEKVYAAGLKALGLDPEKIPAVAYGETFRAVAANRSAAPAMDSRRSGPGPDARSDFNSRFANRARLIKG